MDVLVTGACGYIGSELLAQLQDRPEVDRLRALDNFSSGSPRAFLGLLAEYCEEHGFSGTALRMSTNYGYSPGVRFNLVVNYFVFRALTGRPLTVYGDGSNWRPFIHVQDAARAYAHAACNPDAWPQRVYNVGTGDGNYRVAEIAEVVREGVRDLVGRFGDAGV